jgi:hypothetical protein
MAGTIAGSRCDSGQAATIGVGVGTNRLPHARLGRTNGGKRSKMKQALADQIDGVLTELDVDRDELTALKRDYLFFASFDLFQIFEMIVEMNVRTNQQRALQTVSQLSSEKSRRA